MVAVAFKSAGARGARRVDESSSEPLFPITKK
jgi:hypothetical protein